MSNHTELPAEVAVIIQRDIRKVETWQDVDRAMGVLRGTAAELASVGADFDAQIAELEAQKAKAVKPLVDKRARVEALIMDFAGPRRDELGKKKSVKLVHGVVGWKLSPKAVAFTHSEQRTIDLAKARGLDSLLKVKTDLDKAAVKKLTAAEQLALGVKITQEERLFVELSESPAIEYPALVEGGAA